jgi:hypothetical protein
LVPPVELLLLELPVVFCGGGVQRHAPKTSQ